MAIEGHALAGMELEVASDESQLQGSSGCTAIHYPPRFCGTRDSNRSVISASMYTPTMSPWEDCKSFLRVRKRSPPALQVALYYRLFPEVREDEKG